MTETPANPRPSPGVLSGEQILALGIIRIKRPLGVETGPEGQVLDEFGLTTTDRQVIARPTSVDLRMGRQYIDCQEEPLSVRTREAATGALIRLPPLGAVLFSTLELVHTPQDVVGRFDLKVSYALRGLVLQVGPQLEPLYEGPLFGLLINLSDDEISLADDALLTAEFSLLAVGNPAANPKRKTFVDFRDFIERSPDVVRSIKTTRLAAVQRDIKSHSEEVRLARSEITSFRSEVNALKSQRWQLMALVVATVGVCVSLTLSALSVIIAIQRSQRSTTPIQQIQTDSSVSPSGSIPIANSGTTSQTQMKGSTPNTEIPPGSANSGSQGDERPK
ncbi:hypothetical protein PHYC_01550 [Phycisphaerales bacterium]|nr:hypothetical protein PHYC_01550 [Phycisphaerales bacterium]